MNPYLRLIFLSVFFLENLFVFGQIPDIKPNYHVKQESKTLVFKTLDYDESQLKKYNSTKFYFWYKAQHVFSTQGGSSGILLDGKFESFYENNHLAESGFFARGLKTGVWNYWNQEGFLVKSEQWKKGNQIGTQQFYNRDGVVFKRIVYKKNAQTIYSADTTIVVRKNSVTTSIHDSLGKTTQIIRTTDGLLDGKQMQRDSLDKPLYMTYKKGVLVVAKEKKQKKQTNSKSDSKEKKSFKESLSNLWNKIFKKRKKENAEQAAEQPAPAKKQKRTKQKQDS